MQLIGLAIAIYVVYALFFYDRGSTSGNDSTIYSDGTRKVEKASGNGHYYMNGVHQTDESYIDLVGNEHRSSGEMVVDNPLTGHRDIYKDNQLVGHERTDTAGIPRRY